MAQTNKPEDKVKDVENINREEVKQQRSEILKEEQINPESATQKLVNYVLTCALRSVPMPQVRAQINQQGKELSSGFNEEQMKEFSLALRNKFERMKQFMEASHQEIISMTSQIGW